VEKEGTSAEASPLVLEGIGVEWTAFIQQQIQTMFQASISHMVQQISKRIGAMPQHASSFASARVNNRAYRGTSDMMTLNLGVRNQRLPN